MKHAWISGSSRQAFYVIGPDDLALAPSECFGVGCDAAQKYIRHTPLNCSVKCCKLPHMRLSAIVVFLQTKRLPSAAGADYKEALLDHLPGVSLGVASKLSPRPAAPLAPRAPQQDTTHSTQHTSPGRRHKAAKRSTLPPLHGSPRPWADGAATSDTPGTDPFHDSRPRVSPPEGVSRSTGSGSTEASPTPSGETVPAGEHWSGTVRCGVNATFAAHAALAAIVLTVQRTFHGHVSAAELKWAFNQTASHLDDLLFATFAPSVTEGGGHVSGVPLAADTEATRFHGAITEAMACLLPGMHKLLLKLPDSAVEGAEVCACTAACMHVLVGLASEQNGTLQAAVR